MIGNTKKPQMSASAQRTAKKQDSFGKTGSETPEEKLHSASLANAGVMVRHALNAVRGSGADRCLIEIQKTAQYWPSWFDKSDTQAFDPPFDATEITVEEVTQDNDIITSVSFSYSGKTYDFVSKIEGGSSNDYTLGAIALNEDGDRVINMEIVRNHGQEQFVFRELRSFTFGTWIENIIRIGAAIEQHYERSG
jgi:hypothetical protein